MCLGRDAAGKGWGKAAEQELQPLVSALKYFTNSNPTNVRTRSDLRDDLFYCLHFANKESLIKQGCGGRLSGSVGLGSDF